MSNRSSTLQVNRELFIISLTIFITVVVWITVELYHIKKNEQFETNYESSLKTEIKPIDKTKVERITREH
ncbi:hypothetical protein COU89_00735 [Candidatus Roizmanbacteria bacterium CG10_big_fil_rev_8_21_14_0_10_45_7]|uniref:Uncharacterized protein n=1 Tax=Candidatus Roizmanbacteria bacterium CG10_big_fil_rev_8_21_14_0_10_45_7 TaxID=1974854 RepID=A0A2M8KVH5_9BACT|nr:MAG: hypothetical protein COU89_00735 [Candidatus Roizmanbacteria bacterium CG10_big_fil_rev_8_21_14_0_10_45_7]